MMIAAASLLLAQGFLAAQNPRWEQTYNMSMSSITMACNQSGWYSPEFGGSFGIASYDWSNMKNIWANQKPMDCEERLVTQAVMTKKANPASHVFTYRNLVKALPWFSSVRTKLDDPAYSGFFLKFKDGINGTYHVPACTFEKCSAMYHDQEQTPEHPKGDGSCVDKCDCGKNPCGEYLWDHRNGTMLREFLVNEFIMGKTGVGHPDIDGLFIDDYWCSNQLNGSCHDPVQGASEINKYQQVDMGLSDTDITDITKGWLQTMTEAQEAMISAKAYTWSLFPGNTNANASPLKIDHESCDSKMKDWCTNHPFENVPFLFGLNMGTGHVLPTPEADISAFLLARGPYAYVGAGVWGMTWPVGAAFDKKRPTVPRPAQMDTDYGAPLGLCKQTGASTYAREYAKASVTLDCSTYTGKIVMKKEL